MRRWSVCLFAVLTAPVVHGLSVGQDRAAAAGVTRTLYVSAADAKGAPITDLKPDEITVREGGRDYPAASLGPATAPMHISIIVDDSGTGGFQTVVGQFIQGALKRGLFAITVLNPEPVLLTDFTADVTALNGALGRLGSRAKSRPAAQQLVDTIAEAATTLQQRQAERPVIVALTLNGEDVPSDVSDRILKKLQNTGAMLNAVVLTSATTGPVLSDGPKQSGGVAEGISGAGNLGAAISRVFNHLSSQYVVTYVLPQGARPSDRVNVATRRKEVKLIAPTHIPGR